jgi:site-specific recombinase XerD
VSAATIRSYRDSVKLCIQYATSHLGRSPTDLLVTEVTADLILEFLLHLEKSRGNSIQTRNHRLSVVRTLFDYIALTEPRLIEHCRGITAIPVKKQRDLPEITYLEKSELEAILRVVDRSTPIGRRDHALLVFMYNTGARAQETADACVSWFTFEPPPRVEILGKRRKWRTCPLWDTVAKELQDLIGHPAGPGDRPVFLNRRGAPLTRFGIWNLVEKYAGKASAVAPSLRKKRITPHVLRHTTAMHLLQSGVEINVIRSWLGHVNLATTHRYVEIDLAMKRKALESCEIMLHTLPSGQWKPAPDILTWLESL